MCYAPTDTSEEEDKNSFYAQLQSVLDKIPNRDMVILMGDMNAKVGADNTNKWQTSLYISGNKTLNMEINQKSKFFEN